MKQLTFIIVTLFIFSNCAIAQDKKMATEKSSIDIPYHQIPDYPETYTPGNIVGRTLDGLGYRYHWATKGLTETDLAHKPSEDGRSAGETLDHLYGLSLMILNAAKNEANIRPADSPDLDFDQKRRLTLENIKAASDILKASTEKDIENYKITFQRGDQSSSFPFWNLLNGPIADAIYHVGQIVVFRRSSGNPLDPGVNVFMGKTREATK